MNGLRTRAWPGARSCGLFPVKCACRLAVGGNTHDCSPLSKCSRKECLITDVAIRVGYSSVSVFNEVFRAAFGTSPQAYFGRGKRRSPRQNDETPKGHW